MALEGGGGDGGLDVCMFYMVLPCLALQVPLRIPYIYGSLPGSYVGMYVRYTARMFRFKLLRDDDDSYGYG